MKYRKIFCILLIIYTFFTACAYADPSAGADHVPGDVIVVFKSDSKLHVQSGKITKTFSALSKAVGGTFTVIHSDTVSEDSLLKEFLARDDVIGASLNRKYKLSSTYLYPNDSLYEYLWGMNAINAPEAWNKSTGSQDVYVIVIDSGVDYTHADLQANYDSTHSKNLASGKILPDDNGHGTHVAGIIGAVGDNELGVVGVNWNTKIISLRIFNENGESYGNEILSALNYVKTLLDSDIGSKIAAINMSFGSDVTYDSPEYLLRDPEYLAMKAISDTNRALFCVAAGNEETELGNGLYVYPASYVGIDNMIVVAAATNDDDRSMTYFTNYSENYVDIAAPGEEILSTMASNSVYVSGAPEYTLVEDGQVYMFLDGSSMSTPYVSGTAALIKSLVPNLSANDIKEAILNGVDSAHATDYTKYGFLDVKGALDYVSDFEINNPQIISYDVPDNAKLHENYTGYFTGQGTPPLTWEISEGSLPDNLDINSDTGTISGVIEAAGVFEFTVKLSDFYGSTSMDFTITIPEEITSPDNEASNDIESKKHKDEIKITIPTTNNNYDNYEGEVGKEDEVVNGVDEKIVEEVVDNTTDDDTTESGTSRTYSTKRSSSGAGCTSVSEIKCFVVLAMLLIKKYARK